MKHVGKLISELRYLAKRTELSNLSVYPTPTVFWKGFVRLTGKLSEAKKPPARRIPCPTVGIDGLSFCITLFSVVGTLNELPIILSNKLTPEFQSRSTVKRRKLAERGREGEKGRWYRGGETKGKKISWS